MEGAPQPNNHNEQSPESHSPDEGQQKRSFRNVLREKFSGIKGVVARLLGAEMTSANDSPRRSFIQRPTTEADTASLEAVHRVVQDIPELVTSNITFFTDKDGNISRTKVQADRFVGTEQPVKSVIDKSEVPVGEIIKGPEHRLEGYAGVGRVRGDGMVNESNKIYPSDIENRAPAQQPEIKGTPSDEVVHPDYRTTVDLDLNEEFEIAPHSNDFASERPLEWSDTKDPVDGFYATQPPVLIDEEFVDTLPPIPSNVQNLEADSGRKSVMNNPAYNFFGQEKKYEIQQPHNSAEVLNRTDHSQQEVNIHNEFAEASKNFRTQVADPGHQSERDKGGFPDTDDRLMSEPATERVPELATVVVPQTMPEVVVDKKVQKKGFFGSLKGFFISENSENKEDSTFLDSNLDEVDFDLNVPAHETRVEDHPAVITTTQIDSVKAPETLAERARREKWTEADYKDYYAGKSKATLAENSPPEDKEKPLEGTALEAYLDKNKNSGVIIASTPEEVSALFKKGTAEYDERRRVEAERLRAIGSIEGSSDVEKSPVQKARENLILHSKKAYKEYQKLHPAARLAISGGLLTAGILFPVSGAVTGGSMAAAGAIVAGKAVMRGFGAYGLGELTESVLRNRKTKGLAEGQKLSEIEERNIKRAKWGVILSSFVLGSYTDAVKLYDMAHDAVQGMLHGATDAAVSHAPSVAASAVPSVDAVASHAASSAASATQELLVVSVADSYGATSVEAAKAGTERLGSLGTTLAHEALVNKGDSLTSIAMRELLPEVFTPEAIITLSNEAKQTFVANIISHLSPEQLQAIGIPGGSEHALQVGQKIDIMKLADMAKHMTLMVDGKEISLIERAYQMSR